MPGKGATLTFIKRAYVERTYKRGPRGSEVVASEELKYDYLCETCGVGHDFPADASEGDIESFLSEHEHGDFRLHTYHPQDLRDLTESQREDAEDAKFWTSDAGRAALRSGEPGPREQALRRQWSSERK